MKNQKMYEADDKMISLIRDNYDLLQSLGSFGISLGFGDKTVQETCEDNQVDTYTFLAVVNYTINGYIRRELSESLNPDDSLGQLIMRFYDEYAHEIRRHMMYEQKTLFPYVETLLEGRPASDYNVETFSKHHGAADKKLRELKLLIIKYLPQDGLHNNQLTATLHDIYDNEAACSGRGSYLCARHPSSGTERQAEWGVTEHLQHGVQEQCRPESRCPQRP